MTSFNEDLVSIGKYSNQQIVLFCASMLAEISLIHPDAPIARWYSTNMGDSDFPVVISGSKEHQRIPFSAKWILSEIQKIPGQEVWEDYFSAPMLFGAMQIGNKLEEAFGKSFPKSEPLLQFARHFRNAAAHGDRWYFRKGEPRFAAEAAGIRLTSTMDGKRATYKTVGPYEYVLYVSEVESFCYQKVVFADADIIFDKHKNEKVIRQNSIYDELASLLYQDGFSHSSEDLKNMISLAALSISHHVRWRVPIKPRYHTI